MKRTLAAKSVVFSMLAAGSAIAGGWNSAGGGDVIGDVHNPWFLSFAVPEIKVCFKRDPATFSASLDQAKRAFERAAGFWTRELGPSRMVYSPNPSPTATPTPGALTPFIPVQMPAVIEEDGCTGDEDLEIDLGWGALSPAQVNFLLEQPEVISIAVRAQYDVQQLRGHGFIFVASDQGAPVPQNPHAGWIPQVWSSDDNKLAWVLAHELGHVLGMPHLMATPVNVALTFGDGGSMVINYNYNLMSERFPEEMVTSTQTSLHPGAQIQVRGFGHLVNTFLPIQESCNPGTGARRWARSVTPWDFSCLAVDTVSGRILAGEKGSETLVVGQIDESTVSNMQVTVDPVVTVKESVPSPLIPYTQTVALPWALAGPFTAAFSLGGTVSPVGDGASPVGPGEPIRISLGPEGLSIDGYQKGQWSTWFTSDDAFQPKF